MESNLSVRETLTTEYVGVSESDSVLGAVRLMRHERAGCVLVVRGSEAVGIMTEWDVLGLVEEEADPATTTVGDVMSSPVLSIEADRSVTDAADMMARENIRNLVVEDEDDVLGVLTQRDVIAVTGSFQGAANATGEPVSSGPAAEPEGEVGQTLLTNGNGNDEFSTQGVCEACGSLTDSLQDANGQLVCPDCRRL
ncbi:cyclic nucleotide-binding/CBS domain-containing protein [Natrialbaceae archaeon A-CW2]|uniref:CBS domain-containing protein n=1 Tax=Natronosalvus amylolyticus TaxID=2961994 RepID=UPI0020CA058E|nr:CBS domain-containing protein [Natronosalvus amylolyticus]